MNPFTQGVWDVLTDASNIGKHIYGSATYREYSSFYLEKWVLIIFFLIQVVTM